MHEKQWYLKDLQHLKASINLIKKLPDEIDFLILDGGEWSTYPEWERLKDRTKIVFLDDIDTFKTRKIRSEILSNLNYKSISDNPKNLTDRSFSIFEKIL